MVANELDEVEDIETRLLIGGTTIGLDAAVEAIHAMGGLAVASHIDREAYSLIGQLGFVPPGLEMDAMEISANGDVDAMVSMPGVEGFPLIRCSDAHRLEEIGRSTTLFTVSSFTIEEMRKAFLGHAGRTIMIGGPTC